jgi:hypothetical protein
MRISELNDKKRQEWIDITKGISMYFIIAIHNDLIPLYLSIFINSFALVSYFILAGFLFHNPKNEFQFEKKVFRIIESILLPYIIYWVLSFALKSLIEGNYNFFLDLIKDIQNGNKLWFMSCLVISEITFAIFLLFFKKLFHVFFFIIINSVLFFIYRESKMIWFIQVSFMANIFIAIGYSLNYFKEEFNNLFASRKKVLLIFLLWIILFLTECYWSINLSFPSNRFGNIFLYLPFSLAGTFVIFYISRMWKRRNSLILFLGQNSLLFYFFQHQAIIIVLKLFKFLGANQINYIFPLIMAFLASLLLVIPIILVKKYFPLLAGKSTFLSKRFN